ncbi:Peptidyl-prolyl cis-trans isomerase cyp10 [Onygenales sp. PD_40]|nr:Peptidyl-prolyl cis-trans isomerase cyp10 [Onygenales sp. PD_40]KAK2779787.1 Peptidyl-prolyl cis-trans isomerase cyp10 [Onygenales sp. PD_12]KAK2788865.1 Peptidyl-prolyl cis-trans isomerase cyp10 [Emmonsiellopsis sp. PD_33]
MSVTLHTTHGDLKVEVFCEATPKTAEVCIPPKRKPIVIYQNHIEFYPPISHPNNHIPTHIQNFLALCASGAYNHTPFHRLIPTFMIQGGDISLSTNPSSAQKPTHSSPLPFDIPKGGTSIYHPAPLTHEIHLPTIRHNARGILSMAAKTVKSQSTSGAMETTEVNGSQFFITFAAAPHLDGKSTAFGKVLAAGEGESGGVVLERLEKAKVKVDRKGRVVQPSAIPEEEVEEEGWEAVGIESVTIHANPFAV